MKIHQNAFQRMCLEISEIVISPNMTESKARKTFFPSIFERCYDSCNQPALVTLLFLMLLGNCYAYNVVPEAAFVADLPGNQGSEAYFGYALGLLSSRDATWLVIGAPKRKSGNEETGSLFKCSINLGKPPPLRCQEVIIRQDKMQDGIRNQSWTGASLDIDESGNVVACAPRWKKGPFENFYQMLGLCYLFGPDLQSNSNYVIAPQFQTSTRSLIAFSDSDYVKYSHHQTGFSSHFAERGTLLLGAPGVYYWKGSLAKLTVDNPPSPSGVQLWNKKDLLVLPSKTPEIEFNSYFGSSLTSGEFDGLTTSYATGIPAGADKRGKVLVFTTPEEDLKSFKIKFERRGPKLGENFGASLAAPDLNGDGKSDLAVGAPIHSSGNSFDAGCVYVYMSGKGGELAQEGTRITGDIKSFARFGTSLGSPGDLDKDGFDDLLVGAPIEDDFAGAVYVFPGGRSGVAEHHSQKLLPQEVSPSRTLKGFGIAFSRPVDVDGNQYPDFAVGSFLSDNAVVMVTRPVMEVEAYMKALPGKLDLSTKVFTLVPCIKFRGIGVKDFVEFTFELTIVQNSEAEAISRFSENGETRIEYNELASKDNQHCSYYKINIDLKRSYPPTSITLRMRYGLENDRKVVDNPVLSSMTKLPSDLILPFVTGCRNNVCVSNLVTTSSFKDFDGTMVIGQRERIRLEIEVENRKDPAFLPNVKISVPRPLLVAKLSADCSVVDDITTVVSCLLRNPLNANEKDSVHIDLDCTKLDDTSSDLEISIIANSSAEIEETPLDNANKLALRLEKIAAIEATGWSNPEIILYERSSEDKIKFNETADIKLVYSIEKTGITPLRSVIIEAYIPRSVSGPDLNEEVQLFSEINYELILQTVSWPCKLQQDITSDSLSRLQDIANVLLTENREEEGHYAENGKQKSLDCSSYSANCSLISCEVGPWRQSYEAASLEISLKMNLTRFGEVVSVKEGFELISYIDVKMKSHPGLEDIRGKRDDNFMVRTMFQPKALPLKSLAWWIYFLIVVGGMLILGLILLVAYKLGFFKRKLREDLKDEKRKTLIENEDVVS